MGAKDGSRVNTKPAYLLAGVTAVRLLATVSSFVSLHVVLLDESHVTLVTAKRLLSYIGKKEMEMLRLVQVNISVSTAPGAGTHHCGSSRASAADTSG